MTEIETALRALCILYVGVLDETREIIVTSYAGNYGRAGFVIAVEGSPPRAVFVLECPEQVIGRVTLLHGTLRPPREICGYNEARPAAKALRAALRQLLRERGLLVGHQVEAARA